MAIGTTSNMEWLSGPGGGSVEYTAGHGIVIDNYDHIISTDQSVVQDKLTAGDNITITNNVISAADQVQSDWAESDTSSPAYIANKPTIPTKTSDLTNDSNFITAADVPSAQVQSDWNETDSSDPAYIVNKPTIPSGNQLLPAATSADEDKVLTVDSNGDPEWAPAQTFTQVQANWNETDSSAVSFIQNKPTIPTKTSDLQNDSNYITASDVPGAQVQSDWTESNTSSPAYIAHKPSLATVATSGSYNDLSDQPTIPSGNQLLPPATSSDEDKVLTVDENGDPVWAEAQGGQQVQSDWTEDDASEASYIQHKPNTKPIQAGTGISVVEYADNIRISGTINAQVQSDWAESDSADMSYVKNKPSTKQIVAGANITITDSQGAITISSAGAGGLPVQADWSQQDNTQLDYIKNKPAIPDAQVQSNWTESNTSSKAFILNKPTTKSIVAGTGISITETATEIIISLA